MCRSRLAYLQYAVIVSAMLACLFVGCSGFHCTTNSPILKTRSFVKNPAKFSSLTHRNIVGYTSLNEYSGDRYEDGKSSGLSLKVIGKRQKYFARDYVFVSGSRVGNREPLNYPFLIRSQYFRHEQKLSLISLYYVFSSKVKSTSNRLYQII